MCSKASSRRRSIFGTVPGEDASASPENSTMTLRDRHVKSNEQRCSTILAMAPTTPAVVRPSRLRLRSSTNRSSNTGSATALKTSSSTASNTLVPRSQNLTESFIYLTRSYKNIIQVVYLIISHKNRTESHCKILSRKPTFMFLVESYKFLNQDSSTWVSEREAASTRVLR